MQAKGFQLMKWHHTSSRWRECICIEHPPSDLSFAGRDSWRENELDSSLESGHWQN